MTTLTERRIAALKAEPADRFMPDRTVPGLYLRLSPKGHRSWGVLIRLRGQRRRVKLGNWPALSLADARRRALDLLRQAEAGGDPLGQAAIAFEGLASKFINSHCKPRNRTWREQARTLAIIGHDWKLDGREVASITRREVAERLRSLTIDGARQVRANRLHALLRKMTRWGLSEGLLEADPLLGLGKPYPEPAARERVLSDDELAAIWAATERPTGAHSTVRLLILLGQRKGEVVGMSTSEIEGSLWRLPASRAKSKRAHVVPLSSLSLAQLAFCWPGPVTSQQKAALDKASGVHDWRLHDLRRTVRTGLARLGVDFETRHKVQNHLSPLGRMEAIYQRHDHLPKITAALELWTTHLIELLDA